jgi:hypothetical protein
MAYFRDAVTFKIWKIFQEAFPESAELGHCYQVRIVEQRGQPPSEMASIQRQITSLPFPTLTNLNLHSLLLRHVHLMDLTNFPNLSVLALEQNAMSTWGVNESGIDDRFMKRWGLLVQEKKAFTKLKVIVFRHFRTTIDSTLTCFERFPSLFLCNVDSLPALLDSTVIDKIWRRLSLELFV